MSPKAMGVHSNWDLAVTLDATGRALGAWLGIDVGLISIGILGRHSAVQLSHEGHIT